MDETSRSTTRSTRAVLFDLDGTLIDSIELILCSFEHTLEAHGKPAWTRAKWLSTLGTPLEVQFATLAEGPEEVEALVATYRAWNLAHHDQFVRPYAGIAELLNSLVERGIRLGVVTSKRRDAAERGLEIAGFGVDFEVLIAIDDVQRPKPHAEPVLRAVKRLGLSVEECWYVGDATHDIASGRSAGVRTAAVTWGAGSLADLSDARPDRCVDEPSSLLSL